MTRLAPKIATDATSLSIRNLDSTGTLYSFYEVQMLSNELDIVLNEYMLLELGKIEGIIENNPQIKELTVHPPLSNFEIEYIILRNKAQLFEYIDQVYKLKSKYNIEINLLFHTDLEYKNFALNLGNTFESILTIAMRDGLNILLENTVQSQDEASAKCSVIEIVNHYRNLGYDNLFACIDTCHVACRANMYREEREEYYKRYFDIPGITKKDMNEIVYQVHFSEALNNDGYINKKTHGRMHLSIDDVSKDLELLRLVGIKDAVLVTEVAEDDYTNRPDQKIELGYLRELLGKRN